MTMNSPDSLAELFHAASPDYDAVATAELMREVGLKCIGFNGVRPPPFHYPNTSLPTPQFHNVASQVPQT
jgi:hypothetical protein